MVMTRCAAVGSMVTGSIVLCLAFATGICGVHLTQKLSEQSATSVMLGSLYFSVPGFLTILAGAKKNGVMMGFALFFNIIAVIGSTLASIYLITFTSAINVFDYHHLCYNIGDDCVCDVNDNGDTVIWNMSCSDIDTRHSITIVLLVGYIILTVTCFTASIFGFLATCCAATDPFVVASAKQSTVHGYPGIMPPAYGQSQPPADGDKSSLIQNMAV